MVEYLPWSKTTFKSTCDSYLQGKLRILDIELGGACNLNCIYCDSPDRDKKFENENEVTSLIESGNFDWLFICGLGEPTVSDNLLSLKKILGICKQNGVRCSMFTNLLNLDADILGFIDDGTLCVMFKLDTFSDEKIQLLYGGSSKDAIQIKRNIDGLVKSVHVVEGCTNICASIVPTTKNYSEIPDIINFCSKHNIFPLIGDLEDSGKGADIYNQLKLSDEDLMLLKQEFGENYVIPICPSVVGGVHISYDGQILVDELTGLSCHWFWLSEPKIHSLGKIGQENSYTEVVNKILGYRSKQLPYVKKTALNQPDLVFGGCGGNVRDLLNTYLQLSEG